MVPSDSGLTDDPPLGLGFEEPDNAIGIILATTAIPGSPATGNLARVAAFLDKHVVFDRFDP